MITTGSKLFFGLSAASIVGLVLWGVANDWGALGTVALASLAVALAFLGSITSFTRDGHVAANDTAAHATSAANTVTARRSPWPLAAAVGAGVTAYGLVSYPPIFKIGIVILIAAGVEWMVQAWAERASADAGFNAEIRSRVMGPLEMPIAGAVVAGIVIYSFSRIMLAIDKDAGVLVFGLVAAVVLFFGALLALKPRLSKGLVAGIAGLALLGLAVSGVASALVGERQQLTDAAEEDHFSVEHRSCDAEEHEWDEKASKTVSAKSNVAAEVVLTADGRLFATMPGSTTPLTSITVQRSNPTNILFTNESSQPRRLTAYYGTVVEDLGGGVTQERRLETCTALTDEGARQLMTFSVPRPSFAATEPYTLFVPGVDGAVIEMLVP